jgi:hypothetical protein
MSSPILQGRRIVAVGLGSEADEERVLLLLDGDVVLISKRAGLRDREAELFAEGVLEGLKIAAQGYYFQEEEDGSGPAGDGPPWSQIRVS